MYFLWLSVITLFLSNSYVYTQELSNIVEVMPQEKTLTPLPESLSMESMQTFNTYRATRIDKSDVALWRDRYQRPQKEYKVSLIGVNINSWLENPEYFNVLKEQARKFSVNALLDNLQANNPNLIFNNPNVVSKALKSDIYTPYFHVISNYTDKNIRFANVNEVISYTRRYHIYGVAAGGLPYFGRPMEGGRREINLGLLSGQIDEAAVKLPETDIFLVAMVNVIPNWLEEGLNVFQVHQQELEILVYAFNRKGKLLGGAGIPMDFVYKGRYFMIDQKIRSKIWQVGVSRQFYIWPSFRMMNDKDKTLEAVNPNITLPIDTWPKLSRKQKYILASINDLRSKKESISVELFSPEGDTLFKPRKVKQKEKIILANRILLHKDSTLLVQNNKTPQLVAYEIIARFNDISTNQISISAKTVLNQKNIPSNEGDKLISIVTYAGEVLKNKIFTHTNKLHYTNDVLSYELRVDPVEYARERKKYVNVPNNLKAFTKQYKKQTKQLVKQTTRENKDKIFWNKFKLERLDIQDLKTLEMQTAFEEWESIAKIFHKESIKKVKVSREIELYQEQKNKLDSFKERNFNFLTDKYVDKTNKLAKAEKKVVARSEKALKKIENEINNPDLQEKEEIINVSYNTALKQEKQAFDELLALYPNFINYMRELKDGEEKFIDIVPRAIDSSENLKKVAELNQIDSELVAVAVTLKKYSPVYKEFRKQNKKQNKQEKFMNYEGFMLGLTRAWTTRTKLADRMDHL